MLKDNFFATRPNSYPQARACKRNTLSQHSTTPSTLSIADNNQPDLIREVLAQSIKISQAESDLKRMKIATFKSASCETEASFGGSSSRAARAKSLRSDSITRVNNESKIKKKRKKGALSRSCITQ